MTNASSRGVNDDDEDVRCFCLDGEGAARLTYAPSFSTRCSRWSASCRADKEEEVEEEEVEEVDEDERQTVVVTGGGKELILLRILVPYCT